MTLPPEPFRGHADYAGVVACVAAAVVVSALSWFKLSSLDIGYHLAYGRHLLDTGHIVDRDPFLYPETAVPFINANWGSQVIMALAERAAGPHGLFALRVLLVAVIFACTGFIARSHAGTGGSADSVSPAGEPRRSAALWLAWTWLLAAMAGYERFSMRPELFSYAVMAAMLLRLVRGVQTWRAIMVLGLLQLLWVNLHSYFLVGLMLTIAFLTGEAFKWLLSDRHGGRPPRRGGPSEAREEPGGPMRLPARRVRWLALALAVQIVVSLINPWHVRGAVFPLRTLQFLHGAEVMGGAAGESAKSAWAEISEFQSPFSFHGQIGSERTIHAYYVLLVVAVLGVVALARRRQFGSLLAVLILLAMSTQMRRNIAQFAFAATPLACGAMAAAMPLGRLDRTLRRHGRLLLALATIALSAWWVYDIVVGRFYYVERRITREFGTGYSERTFPRAAVQWLAAHGELKPDLFVDYFSSSNTLPWLPSRFKLFVDTNTFACADETLRTAFNLGRGEIDHGEFFRKWGINIVLLHGGPDTQLLVRKMMTDDGEWALAYFDPHAVIFVRRIPEHLPVIPSAPLSASSLDAKSWVASLTGSSYTKALTLGTMVNVPMSLGWSEPAATLMEEAVRLAPDYFEAWNYFGVCHGNLGNSAARARDYAGAERHWLEAIRCWNRVLALSPGHAESTRYLEATRQRLEMLRQVNQP